MRTLAGAWDGTSDGARPAAAAAGSLPVMESLEPRTLLSAAGLESGLPVDGSDSPLDASLAVLAATAAVTPPVVVTNPAALTVMSGTKGPVDVSVTIKYTGSPILTGATVRIAANYLQGQDGLGFVNQPMIVGAFDAATGTLTLTGADSVAGYEQALRTVTFTTTDKAAAPLARTVSFTVSDGTVTSKPANRVIRVTPLPKTTGQFGLVNGRHIPTLRLTDPDGTHVILTLSGHGTGEVTNDATGGWFLTFTSTDARSAVTITTVKSAAYGDDGQVDFAGITADASLASLRAGMTNLKGDLSIAGTIGNLLLKDVKKGLVEIKGPGTAASAVVMRFDHVKDSGIDCALPITSLRAQLWVTTTGKAKTIKAPRIGTLLLTGDKHPVLPGDFGPNLLLTGAGVPPTAMVLGSARIPGSLTASTWDIRGKVGPVTVGGIVAETGKPWDVRNVTSIASLTLGDVADATITVAGNIGAIRAKRWADGSITAARIASITVTGVPGPKGVPLVSGDFGADVTLTETARQALSRLSATGWLVGATISSLAPIGTIAAGGIRDSTISAGAPGIHTSLTGLTVSGIKGAAYAFMNSNVSAWTLGSVSLKAVQTANESLVTFGITAHTLASYVRDGKRAPKAAAPATVDICDNFLVQLVVS